MKTLTQTIIALAALSMLATVFAQAPPAPIPPTAPPVSTPPPIPSVGAPPTEPASVSNVDDNVYNLTRQLDDLTRDLSFGSRSGSTGTVLVIPSEQTSTEDLITINEDMSVMSRIFEKNLEQDRIATSSSIFVSRHDRFVTLLGGGRGKIQSMYLQGFGALFMMKVDFPLTPPPDMQDDEKQTEKDEQGDKVWREMRQQMYEPENVDRRRRTDRPEERYDGLKVENLKTTLIKALKHASNIRCLKPDESVVLTVVGKGEPTGVKIEAARVLPGENRIVIRQKNAEGRTMERIVQGTSLDVLDNIGLSSPSVLVIRAKKSDIDRFAKDSMNFENFRRGVQLLTYPLLGGTDGGHGDPFDAYYRARSTGSSNMRR
ncbi:MAG: hypothetical protein ACYSTT_08545 [Planctomycetota bacterium]|jgi:hypothetical protein